MGLPFWKNLSPLAYGIIMTVSMFLLFILIGNGDSDGFSLFRILKLVVYSGIFGIIFGYYHKRQRTAKEKG
ncbi:MAG: hypothetical protein V3W18_05220 [candidate division Zixibacteria bacterium]